MSVQDMVNDPEMGFRGLTRAEYDALIETGALDDQAVELIEGALFPMAPQGPMHSGFADRLAWRLNKQWVSAGEERYRTRLHSPLAVGDRSQPEPDLYVYDVSQGSLTSHPTSAHLIVEIAFSSHSRDLIHKPRVYAAGGFPELWVVDLPALEVVVHRDPRTSPVAGYASVQRLPFTTELSILGVTVRLSDLLDD